MAAEVEERAIDLSLSIVHHNLRRLLLPRAIVGVKILLLLECGVITLLFSILLILDV
jgi:hypothetical protein